MANTRVIDYLAKFAGGLNVPTGAGNNKVLTSNSEGNAEWQTNLANLSFPTAWPTFKETGSSITENKSILVESFSRLLCNSSLTLTSGTPVITAIPVPAKTILSGVAFAVKTVEGTAVNRTHLWSFLLDLTGKVLCVSADYTSSINTPMNTGTRRALLFTEKYETSVPVLLYTGICEVMSSTAAITIYHKTVESFLTESAPALIGTGGTGKTTPPEVGSTLTFSATGNGPWFGLV